MSTGPAIDTARHATHKTPGSRRSRSSRHSRLKIWGLGLALLITIVILFISFVYSSSRIAELTRRAGAIQDQLFLKEQEVEQLKSRLTHSNLLKLVPDQVFAINRDSIKNIVFSVVSQGGSKIYEYKLVVENLSQQTFAPKFRVLVFDKDGIQIGIDQVLKGEKLAPGESRSYSSRVDLFMKEEPAYFHVSGTIPAGAERMQELLNMDGLTTSTPKDQAAHD